MEKYTDDDIRKMDKITCKIAADYLGISPNLLTIGMRNDKLPIGFAVRQEDRYRENWTYAIIPERLIAYKHGKINEVQVQGIEHNLETIIKEFTEMKKDLRQPLKIQFLFLNIILNSKSEKTYRNITFYIIINIVFT